MNFLSGIIEDVVRNKSNPEYQKMMRRVTFSLLGMKNS